MSWIDGWRHRLRAVFDSGAFERELEEEMQHHLDLDAMQQRDPRRAALRFGNRTWYREETRRLTWMGAIDPVRQDLAYAVRAIARSPGFTLLVAVTLALGFGTNATIFAMLDMLYLRPPGGIAHPETLRRIWLEHHTSGRGVPLAAEPMSYPQARAMKLAAQDSASVAVYHTNNSLRLGAGRSGQKVHGVYASANYFTVLGVRPAFGRFYIRDEDRFGNAASVIVLSHGFWSRELNGDSGILGKAVTIGRDRFTVIGVADPAFTGLDLQVADVWMPLGGMRTSWLKEPWWESDNIFWYRTVVRVPDGFDDREFEARATRLVVEENRRMTQMKVDTAMRVFTGSIIEARGPGKPGVQLLIASRLAGVAAIILFIACANVINLLLARAVARRREIAVRLALGISRWRLVRLLAMETVLLALIASVAAVLASFWGSSLLRALLFPEVDWTTSAIHWRVIVFAFGTALVAALVAGFVPALQASNPRLTNALTSGSREGTQHRSRLRGALVVAQAALSVLLLAGAALFVRSLQNVQRLDIGFDARQLVFGSIAFEEGSVPPAAVVNATLRDIATRLERDPSVEMVARASDEPMQATSFVEFFTATDSSGAFGRRGPVLNMVSPGFFQASGIRLRRGVGLALGKDAGAAREVVVNEATAALLWPGQDAIGQCMRFVERTKPCHIVVGIVENVHQGRVIEEQLAPQYYLSLDRPLSEGSRVETIVVRARPNATGAAAAALRAALRGAFSGGEATVTPMMENLEPEYRPWRLGARLFTTFGLLALLVAVVGIYSTVSYAVSQRTHEFGVRIALGAQIADVLRLVVGEGLRTVATGIALGVALAIAAGRLISPLLYGIAPNDPVIMLAVSASLLVVAALAAMTPAWRAARVDPLQALKTE